MQPESKIKLGLVLALISVLGATLFLPASAAAPTEACGGGQSCYGTEVGSSITTVLAAGNIRVAITHLDVQRIGDQGVVSVTATTPNSLGTGTVAMAVTPSSVVGCTTGTASTAGVSLGSYGERSYSLPVTLTAATCSGLLHIVVSAGTVVTTIWDQYAAFSVKAVSVGDVQNRLCLASATNAACTIPEIAICNASDVAASNICKDPDGRLFVCNASTADPLVPASCMTLNVDNENRICNPSVFGAACSTLQPFTDTFFAVAIGILLALAIFGLGLPDPGAKVFAGVVSMIAGFLAFNLNASIGNGVGARVPVILACFLLMAYCYFRAYTSLMEMRRNASLSEQDWEDEDT